MKVSIAPLALAGILASASPVIVAEAINVPAPDFTLESRSGENLRLEDHRGEVVMLNFWASWCGPCRQEMPLMDELYSQYKDLGFTIFAVNVDENRVRLSVSLIRCRSVIRFSMIRRVPSVSCTRFRPCQQR